MFVYFSLVLTTCLGKHGDPAAPHAVEEQHLVLEFV